MNDSLERGRAVVIYRQERKREERRRSLYQEILRGRLRQGWAYERTFDLRQGKAGWMRSYGRSPVDGDEPKSTYEKIAGILRIRPGDLVVVPNQPDDRHFLTCEAVASEVGSDTPCYDFIGAVHGDFRHCTPINPASIREYRYTNASAEIRESLTGGYYRSPVQFVNPKRASKFLALIPDETHIGPRFRRPENKPGKTARVSNPALAPFAPKPDSDCVAHIRGGTQIKTRQHETLVRFAGNWLRRRGAKVHTPHPIDLYASSPEKVIFEAKVSKGSAAAAVREALGQLYWYRFKHGPRDAVLCVLLDKKPSDSLIEFVESGLGMMIVWAAGRELHAGAQTAESLAIFAQYGSING